ncbi:UDP-3-O-acyl-N-acetylglucosamine deacetylase, partial [Klebsiella pneumoniae]
HNILIEIDGPEIPIVDGSALSFVELFEKADVVQQEMFVESYVLKEPVYWSQGNVHLVALPAKELRFSYTLSYPNHPLLEAQFHTFV